MMNFLLTPRIRFGFYFSTCFALSLSVLQGQEPDFSSASPGILWTPKTTHEAPGPGKRVFVTPGEFTGTQVYHTLYLPSNWDPSGSRIPIVFEYTGNYFPASGSTGEVKDAGLGYGISGGQFIWVSLPYISEDGRRNQITWWGDADATVSYAKKYVPQIISTYHADPNNVILCGFSRGAIGVNYLGLHDDEVASLWTAFFTHDHFDGVRQWGRTSWGSPLEKYRAEAAVRLERVGARPYLVSQHGTTDTTERFVRSVLSDTSNFTFLDVNTVEALGAFPNDVAKHRHTDRWLAKAGRHREQAWEWIQSVVEAAGIKN